jgi:hypothetical protein
MESGEHKQEPRRAKWHGLFTEPSVTDWLSAITAIAAVVLACIANTTANESLVASRAAVELAGDTAKIQLRAYVVPTSGEALNLVGRGPVKVRVTVQNFGQTPASETGIESEAWWEYVEPEPPEASDNIMAGEGPVEAGSRTTLGVGDTVYRDHTVDDYRRLLFAGKVSLHVAGEVIFSDVFGVKHAVPFHYVQGGDFDPKSKLMGAVTP